MEYPLVRCVRFVVSLIPLATMVVAAMSWRVPAVAQPDGNPETKSLQMVRVEGNVAVDGVLNEDVWSRATIITDLHQVEPVEFSEPSQRTEIRVFYDDETLYMGARVWDTDMEHISANVLRQGSAIGNDDRVGIIIDPYLDRRSGYTFRVNSNGVRWDALYKNVSVTDSNWDAIWDAAVTRDADGWTAEMAIPFKTLSFNPNSTSWGLNFIRTIERHGETIGWVSRNRQQNPGVAGIATGFEGLQQGLGLDVVPSASVHQDKIFSNGATNSDFEPSIDIFYKITPLLNAALTVNTDFSATEVDDRQVNLTRFSLFFPEKRDFFLQDSDIFEFGRIGSTANGANAVVPNAAAQNARPFFSRRIGLGANGRPTDIEYGGKLSGRVGRWNVGTLAIRQGETAAVEAADVFVGRAAANVLGESTVGLIATDGDPRSNLDNSLIGTDFLYRNSHLPGGKLMEAQAWYQETDSENLSGDDRAFGYGISLPNSTGFRAQYKTSKVEANFNPALGFVDRRGIRDYALDFGYRKLFRDSWLRSVFGGFDGFRTQRLDDGSVESQALGLRYELENNTQDIAFVRTVENRESLLEDFVIYTPSNYDPRDPTSPQPVVIPAGDYSYTDWQVGIETGLQRRIAMNASIKQGGFYDGERTETIAGVKWWPSPHFGFGLDYAVDDIDLPAGDFIVRLTSLRTEIVFSSKLSLVNRVQYDNVTESMGINSRLHWIPRAGREGFVVLNHNLADRDKDNSFQSTTADVAVKFSYTWRF
jgi:hypothetical protein